MAVGATAARISGVAGLLHCNLDQYRIRQGKCPYFLFGSKYEKDEGLKVEAKKPAEAGFKLVYPVVRALGYVPE